MNIKENIRRIIKEEVNRKYVRSSENLTKQIINYLDKYFSSAKTKISNKGYYVSCELCVNGDSVMNTTFYFGPSDDDEDETPADQFNTGYLFISEDFVKRLSTVLPIKKSYILHIIEEWFEDKYIDMIEKEANVSGIYISEIDLIKPRKCVFVEIPNNITDEEMIDYIDKHTGYKKDEIIQRVESGEIDLRNEYLDVLERQEDKRINGDW